MKTKTLWLAALPLAAMSTHSIAQSSVTLYGIVDAGLFYTNNLASLGSNANGHSAIQAQAGVWTGSQFRLDGKEDLGGGTKAIFSLNSRFNLYNGASQFSNAMFGQWAYVGLSDVHYGTLTAGRQLPVYNSILLPYSPVNWLTGFSGAHPGDLDNFDTIYKTNNTLTYVSPEYHGLTVGAAYAFGGVPGSLSAGASWSAAARYQAGAAGIAVGFERFNNASTQGGAWNASSTAIAGTGQQGVSSVTNGFQTSAAQQRFAVVGGYEFTSQLGAAFSYSNVQYIAGAQSLFHSTAVWNTFGGVVHYKLSAATMLAAGYSYTRAARANGITNGAQYHQVSLAQYYALSKRTGLYAVEAWQRARGQTLAADGATIINATATIGDGFNSSPSSGPNQITAGFGLIQRF
jgi:predicted porin